MAGAPRPVSRRHTAAPGARHDKSFAMATTESVMEPQPSCGDPVRLLWKLGYCVMQLFVTHSHCS